MWQKYLNFANHCNYDKQPSIREMSGAIPRQPRTNVISSSKTKKSFPIRNVNSKNLNPATISVDQKFDPSFAICMGKDDGIDSHNSRSKLINDANETGIFKYIFSKVIYINIDKLSVK